MKIRELQRLLFRMNPEMDVFVIPVYEDGDPDFDRAFAANILDFTVVDGVGQLGIILPENVATRLQGLT